MCVAPLNILPAPLTFGRSPGWLYQGIGPGAVLLCGPVGFEALCVRQSWHALACLIAANGPSVLRFDYPGEGDALDRNAGESIRDAAAEALKLAAETLRRTTGVETISFVALRMGVPLAVQAFDRSAVFDKIVLLEPVFDGRSFIRELKATARILNDLRPAAPGPEGSINVCGFVLDAADVADFSAIKLTQLADCASLHIVHSNTKPLPEWLPDHQTLPFDDFAAMNVPPTQAQVPLDTFNSVAALFAAAKHVHAPTAHPATKTLRHDTFTEESIRFGQNGVLAGVLCEPTAGAAGGRVVHILNAGANAHIGWARMGTEHARALAGAGIASLRYDFRGIGDSVWQGQNGRDFTYCPAHIEDALAAVDETCARGYGHAVLAGLCSGGYVAFRAAARDPRIGGVIAANALRLIWHPHDTLDSIETRMVQADQVYRDKIFSIAEWKRLITGGISPGRIVQVGGTFAARLAHKVANATGFERLDSDNRDVRATLKAIVDRDAAVVFVHSDRDQSDQEATRHFGPGSVWALRQPNVSRIVIDNADHELSQPWARDRLLAIMIDLVRHTAAKV